ncbi:hypothetical protein PSACC_00368 [Paramicrosporidium saccamoebae]|uniref:Uncharacterized protein n=1 Tax=Paramicrosporidium saccamoebae TaxID=1246581 RepID=A0A2H9TPT2_9FUNG|nr:hypothetical protein PSACC_00368 [Paramicrosporidium saccamoebae]
MVEYWLARCKGPVPRPLCDVFGPNYSIANEFGPSCQHTSHEIPRAGHRVFRQQHRPILHQSVQISDLSNNVAVAFWIGLCFQSSTRGILVASLCPIHLGKCIFMVHIFLDTASKIFCTSCSVCVCHLSGVYILNLSRAHFVPPITWNSHWSITLDDGRAGLGLGQQFWRFGGGHDNGPHWLSKYGFVWCICRTYPKCSIYSRSGIPPCHSSNSDLVA